MTVQPQITLQSLRTFSSPGRAEGGAPSVRRLNGKTAGQLPVTIKWASPGYGLKRHSTDAVCYGPGVFLINISCSIRRRCLLPESLLCDTRGSRSLAWLCHKTSHRCQSTPPSLQPLAIIILVWVDGRKLNVGSWRRRFAGSKDGSIVKWSLETGERTVELDGNILDGDGDGDSRSEHTAHTGPVLALAVSSDGSILASGGADKLVCAWDANTLNCLRRFKGHRGAVTCLSFQKQALQLFSGSVDRTVKVCVLPCARPSNLWSCFVLSQSFQTNRVPPHPPELTQR